MAGLASRFATAGDKRWIIHAPKPEYTHVYLAMWAMLRAVHLHNNGDAAKIKRVVCPGLGTGTGRVPMREAARQMALAYRNYLNPPKYIDWSFASDRQVAVRYGGDDGFRFPPMQ